MCTHCALKAGLPWTQGGRARVMLNQCTHVHSVHIFHRVSLFNACFGVVDFIIIWMFVFSNIFSLLKIELLLAVLMCFWQGWLCFFTCVSFERIFLSYNHCFWSCSHSTAALKAFVESVFQLHLIELGMSPGKKLSAQSRPRGFSASRTVVLSPPNHRCVALLSILEFIMV